MLTEKDYCDYDTCVALKELGFPIDWFEDETWHENNTNILLYSAQKWLREEKNLHITIFSSSQESWMYRITKPHQKLEDGMYGEDFTSYEEALLEGVKEAVKLLKEEKK